MTPASAASVWLCNTKGGTLLGSGRLTAAPNTIYRLAHPWGQDSMATRAGGRREKESSTLSRHRSKRLVSPVPGVKETGFHAYRVSF